MTGLPTATVTEPVDDTFKYATLGTVRLPSDDTLVLAWLLSNATSALARLPSDAALLSIRLGWLPNMLPVTCRQCNSDKSTHWPAITTRFIRVISPSTAQIKQSLACVH